MLQQCNIATIITTFAKNIPYFAKVVNNTYTNNQAVIYMRI